MLGSVEFLASSLTCHHPVTTDTLA